MNFDLVKILSALYPLLININQKEIYRVPKKKLPLHFIPASLDTNLCFASLFKIPFVPPPGKLAIFAMRGVGTTSWFLVPISVCSIKRREEGRKQKREDR